MTDQYLDKIARVVHAAIREWQRANGQAASRAWDNATWERDSTRDAVRQALNNPTPGQSHERWRAERLAQGWTYGPVKDADKKTNPSLVPFDDLPAVEIVKDHLIIAITQALKAGIDDAA